MIFRLALAFGCTVRELLARLDSHELAEWQAFEHYHGPIDDTWRDTVLGEILFEIKLSNAYFVAANSEDPDVDEPKRVPLPWEVDKVNKDAVYLEG